MPWDPVKYLWVHLHLTITGKLTFNYDYVRKKTLDTIKQLTKQMYHPQQIHWVVRVAIIPIFAITNRDSQEIIKFEILWMRAYKKAWRINASLPDVTFWARPEQEVLGTPKARVIITTETISLMNQCMYLNDDP